MSRTDWLASLDPGIAPYVRVLAAADVETFESCEGGDGHSYPEPTIRFAGQRDEGFRALAVALQHGLPVRAIRRYWAVIDGEPRGPDWEITFWRPAPTDPRCSTSRTLRTDAGRRQRPRDSARA